VHGENDKTIGENLETEEWEEKRTDKKIIQN